MIIGSSSYESITEIEEAVCHNLSIFEGLLGIMLKTWSLYLSKRNGNRRNRIHMRSTLHSWEHCTVNPCWEIFYRWFRLLEGISDFSFTENQSPSRATKRFMGRCHHRMESVIKRIFEQTCCDKTSDMRNISIGNRPHFLSNLCKFRIIKLPWICTKSS